MAFQTSNIGGMLQGGQGITLQNAPTPQLQTISPQQAAPIQSTASSQVLPVGQITDVGAQGQTQPIQYSQKGNVIPAKLPDTYRSQLTGVVQQMANDGQNPNAINSVISDYKTKFADGELKLQQQEREQTQQNQDKYGTINPSLADKFDAKAFGGIAHGVLDPLAQTGVAAYNLGASGVGAVKDLAQGQSLGTTIADAGAEADRSRSLPFFGQTEPITTPVTPQNTKGTLSGAGRELGGALKIASNVIGGEGIGSAIDNVGNTFLRRFLTGAIQGAKFGITYGAGTGLQDPNTFNTTPLKGIGNFAKDTGISTALGAVAGGTVGGIAGARQTNTLINDIDNSLNFTPTQKADLNINPSKLIAEEQLPINVEDGKLNAEEAMVQNQKNLTDSNDILNTLLKSEKGYIDADQMATTAKINASRTLSGTARDNAIAHIDAESTAYKKQYGIDTNGKTLIPMADANIIKQDLWNKGKFDIRTPSNISTTSRIYGNAFKQAIEDGAESKTIKALNQRIGDLAQLQDALELRNGKPVGGGGGTGKIVAKVLGGIAGSHGGPLGTILGAKGGEFIQQIMTDGSISDADKTAIYNKFNETPAGQQALSQARQAILERMKQGYSGEIKALPQPTDIRMPEKTPPQGSNMEVKSAQLGIPGRNPKTGRMFRTYKSN